MCAASSRRKRRRRDGATAGGSPPDPQLPSSSAGASPQPPAAPSAGGARLGARAGALVAGVAFLARWGVARELADLPLWRTPQLDAHEFLEWARRIAGGGDLFPFYPTHGPIYPLFLALLVSLVGESLTWIRLLQSAIGAVTATLAASLSARTWDSRPAGLATGLLLALYGPLVFVETAIWEEVLLLVFVVAALRLLVAPAGPGRAALAGALFGLAVAVRPTLAAALALSTVTFFQPRRWPRARACAAGFLLAAALVVAPVVLGASRATGAFLFVRGFGAINVWLGNDPAGGGVQNARLGGDWDRAENAALRAGVTEPSRLERFYLGLALDRIREDPAGFAGVVASKLVWLVSAEEPRDNHSYAFFREPSSWLRLLPGFGLLLPLAAVGLGVGWSGRRRFVLIAAYLAGVTLPVLAALVGLRYRLPVVPALAVVAGGAVPGLAARYRRGERRAVAAWIAVAIALAVAVQLRRHAPTHNFAEEWAHTGAALESEGRLDEAERAFQRSAELDATSALGPEGIGRLRIQQRRFAEAEAALREAVRRDDGYARARYHLGLALEQQGRAADAAAAYESALALAPRQAKSVERLAPLSVTLGRLDRAAELYRVLVAARPGEAASWLALAPLEGARGRLREGLEAAQRATALDGADPRGWLLVGALAVELGEGGAARRALDALRASPLATSPDVELLGVAVAYLEGRRDEADGRLRALLERSPGSISARRLLLRHADSAERRAAAEAFLRQLDRGR